MTLLLLLLDRLLEDECCGERSEGSVVVVLVVVLTLAAAWRFLGAARLTIKNGKSKRLSGLLMCGNRVALLLWYNLDAALFDTLALDSVERGCGTLVSISVVVVSIYQGKWQKACRLGRKSYHASSTSVKFYSGVVGFHPPIITESSLLLS